MDSYVSKLLKKQPEGSPEFPIYHIDDLKGGKVFAQASMGFMSRIEAAVRGQNITVKTTTLKPVLAALGCQLAGWTVGNAMISGPVRMKAMKPRTIFNKLTLGNLPALQSVACVEGEVSERALIDELVKNDIESAEILWTKEDSKAQFINIPARAIEIVLFRLMFMTDINKFNIKKAVSEVTASMDTTDPSGDLNDAIRYKGKVTLTGDFPGFKNFEPIVTKNTGLEDRRFSDVMAEKGSVAHCPLELFSVAQLEIVEPRGTKVF